MSFIDSPAVITGASKGIGREIAYGFARAQHRRPLLLIARSADKLEEVAEECRQFGAEEVQILPVDLTDPEALSNGGDTPAQFQQPGILVNNAGYYLPRPLAEINPKEFEEQWRFNTATAFYVIHHFLDAMKKRDRGLIVNICSISAVKGKGNCGAYSSAKHALLGMTRSLREELKPTGIGVTAINLGQTLSSSWDDIEVDPARIIDPKDVAGTIVHLTTLAPQTVIDEIIMTPQKGELPPEKS